MKIILIGIQGAGKSTQGNMLSQELGIPYLSSGHIFREMTKEKTDLGRWLKETLNAGLLVPDEDAVKIVMEYLQKPEYANGYIMDGFPRTIPQAKILSDGTEKAVFIDVSDREALWRISGRVADREDETLQAIRKRISLFHELTEQVIEFYRETGRLIQVNGEEDVETVFANIMKHLKA
jgi:adenylate kinase